MGSYGYYGGWPPYVPVAERRRKAQSKLEALKKKGRVCQPVTIEGRTIARTFWGKNWCEHLEKYSDYENRLPRGRTYVRNGSVIDLQITAGKITALVSGSDIYEVSISIHSLEDKLWQAILKECAGKVASLVELLQGRLSSAVMEVVTRHGSGLFPIPKQINFRCSCPDSASMCKHIAATLYGIGARLDAQPELLFLLRGVDPQELILQAGNVPLTEGLPSQLETTDLSSLFGIELDETPMATSPVLPPKTSAPVPASPATQKRVLKAKPVSTRKAIPQAQETSSAKKTVTTPRPKRAKTITASELSVRGVPRHMVQSWLDSDVLLRTEKRGEYRVTKQTEERIARYLTRRQSAGRK